MNRGETANIVEIRTPEGIIFPLRLASPVLRGVAFAVDFFCILTIQKCCSILIMFLCVISEDIAFAVSVLLYFSVSILYGIILEFSWNGRTVGKKLLGLRVVDADGLKLRPAQLIIRNLLRAVDVLPGFYMVGGLTSILSPGYQRLGDIAGRTFVVREKHARDLDLSMLQQDKYNSFWSCPYAAAKARAALPPETADLLLKALLRRNSLKPECRTEIYSAIVQYLKEKVKFPQEATDGLSDERYLRNMIDILYRR